MSNTVKPVVTATGIPAHVDRDAYLDMVRGLGIDPDVLISLAFEPTHITAVIPAFDEDGNRILSDEFSTATHHIVIPITGD